MAPSLKLRWTSLPVVSGYHAVEAMHRKRPLADDGLAGALNEPAQALLAALAWDTPQPERFLLHLVPLSARVTGNLELAKTALTKVLRRDEAEALGFKYRGLLTDVENAFRGELPRLQEQLPILEEPLQQAWVEHGQLLLVEICRETEEGLFVEEAEVLLLHPVLGGAGNAHMAYNSARIETVPADVVEGLPEVVRLAWLLARLNLDLPKYSDLVKGQKLDRVGALAMIPIVLAAAREAELAGNVPLERALAAWMPGESAGTAEKLQQWGEVYRDTRPPLGAALGALERMLE